MKNVTGKSLKNISLWKYNVSEMEHHEIDTKLEFLSFILLVACCFLLDFYDFFQFCLDGFFLFFIKPENGVSTFVKA